MRASDLTIEVRNRSLQRQGLILTRDLDLETKLRWSGVGEWKLTLPGDHPMVPHLRTPGSGLIATGAVDTAGTLGTVFSGPTVRPMQVRNLQNPDGTLTFTGVTDEIFLQDSLAYPDPTSANPAVQASANDVRSGAAETLMRAYLDANVGPSAPAGRRRGLLAKITLDGSDLGRGVTTQKSPRFQNLLELLQELAVESTLGFRVVQEDESLVFKVVGVRDLRKVVRLDVDNGTLTSEEVAQQGATLTRAIVAGQGDGVDRTIVVRTTADSTSDETDWGRAVERFFDRRDTDDTLELEAKGDEELELARGGTAAKVVPADDATMRYLVDWREGDWLTVVVGGQEETSVVTEAVILIDKDRAVVGAALGDVTTFDPRDQAQAKQETLDSRLGYLERASSGPVATDRLNAYEVRLQGTTAERDAHFGVPATNAERASLANRRVSWFNTDLGWEESYYATTGLAGLTVPGLVAGVPHGWFPTGEGPVCTLRPSAGVGVAAGGYVSGWNGSAYRRGGASWFTYAADRISILKPGRYELSGWTIQQSGTGVARYSLRVNNAAVSAVLAGRSHAADALQGSPTLTPADYSYEMVIDQSANLMLYVDSGSLSVHQTAEANGVRGQLRAKYVGPPLVLE